MAAERAVLVIPGANLGAAVPQLLLPAIAAERRRATVDRMAWRDVEQVDGLSDHERPRWVEQQVAPHLERLPARGGLVIAESLGSYAATLVADRVLPAIWVTPLLTEGTVAEALRRASAPFLLVGGTADPWWDGGLARTLTPHVLELPGADHALFLPGPLRRSTANLGRLSDASEAFLDEVVWPTA